MIPVTIVTGALGAGKTTFVNYVLTEEHGLKIGVIVNEYGEIGIDGDLIIASKDKLIELPNGCICCTVRGDLIEAVRKLLATKKIDYLLIETSGLAEVVPAAMTFNAPEFVGKVELDSIICVIDAENYAENMKRNETAFEQLQNSDIVLLNKVDIVKPEQVYKIKKEIKKHVPNAQIIETQKCRAPLKLLLGVAKFDTGKQVNWKRKEHEHAHNTGIESISSVTGPVDSEKFEAFWQKLPENIFRAKGIVCIKESQPGAKDELRVAFHKVGKRWDMDFTRPWEKGEKKQTKVVFIGTKLNEKELEKGLGKCS